MSFNVRQLEDRATDVDPDLRYMALEDLQKYLTNPKIQVRNVASFVPLSFRLLGDSVSEVQNQSVRTFPLLIRHVSDAEVLLVVERLYMTVENTVTDLNFLTSVPHLALRSIFNDSSSRFQNLLAQSVFSLLIPKILDGATFNIDKVEILIDLLRNLGRVLLLDELSLLVYSLVEKTFALSGIVGKRCIVGIDECLSNIGHSDSGHKTEFYEGLIQKIQVHALCATFYTLVQVILARAQKVLSSNSIDLIFEIIEESLTLDLLEVSLEDVDVDSLINLNQRRETCLLTLQLLIACIPSGETARIRKVVEITSKFLVYDPFETQENDDSDDYVSDFDSDFDFEDEEIEQFEGTGENDAFAAKLRLSALANVKSLVTNHPELILLLNSQLLNQLSALIGDKTDFVSDQAVECCVLVIARSANAEFLAQIESQLFSVLLTQKNIMRFNTTKRLIEALIENAQLLSSTFLFRLYDQFLAFKISIQSFSDIARLYKVIFEEYTVLGVPPDFLNYMIHDMELSLSDPNIYHNLLNEILLVLQILYLQSLQNEQMVHFINNDIFPKIADKVSKRQYPSDLRQSLLNSLTGIITSIPLTPENSEKAMEVFLQSFDYEISMNFTLECLINVLLLNSEFLQPQLQQVVLTKIIVYLKSSDSSLYMLSLRLLGLVLTPNKSASLELIQEIRQVLLDLVRGTSEIVLMNACFDSLRQTLRYIPADEDFFRFLLDSVINVKLVDVDNINIGPVEELIEAICETNTIGGERIYQLAMQSLIWRNFISAKMMSILVFKLGLQGEIGRAEEELTKENVEMDKIIFDIHFLGCISSRHEIKSIHFGEFLDILNSPNEQIALAAARAIGLLVLRDFDLYLPRLLGYYHEVDISEQKRILLLVAIKQVLKESSSKYHMASLREIWKNILDVILKKEGQINSKKTSELKLAGDILSKIVELDTAVNYQQEVLRLLDSESRENQFFIYTVVVIVKELVNKAFFEFDIENVKRMVQFLVIPNIELKLAIMSTLLTGIYTKSKGFAGIVDEIILPRVYDELTAKEEFKKVIPMGPYKYVIDEGLEVRKLGYELISAVINISNDPVQSEFNVRVNEVRLFEVLCSKGLKDSENDIINLTIHILMQLVQKDENVLTNVSNLADTIALLSKLMNRKLRAKASTQETEGHEETVRNVIRFSKMINESMKKNHNAPAEWTNFYYELQNKHQLLFNSV